MKPVLRLLIVLFLAVGSTTAQHDARLDTVSVRPAQLTESVYILYGHGGNIGLSVGNDGPLIVDDQFEEISDSLQATVGRISGHPVQLAINSHWHYDHSDGNKALGPDGVIIVAHENSRSRMQEPQILSGSEYHQAAYHDDALPSLTFERSITLYWNDDEIEIFHAPRAHTDGDAIVWFKSSNVFHMGDVFVTYGFPYIDNENGGDVAGIIAACRKVIELSDDDTWFIPGHGQPSRKSDVIEFVEMLETLRNRVEQMVQDGDSLDDILAANPTDNIGIDELSAEQAIRWTYQSIERSVPE